MECSKNGEGEIEDEIEGDIEGEREGDIIEDGDAQMAEDAEDADIDEDAFDDMTAWRIV